MYMIKCGKKEMKNEKKVKDNINTNNIYNINSI